MDVRMVDAGGVRLACRMSGRSEGHRVVVLHTLGRDGSDWDEVARRLGGSRWVCAPDLRGHGLTGGAGAESFEVLRDDLGALLEKLGPERVSLVGHGAGGVAAYLYAAKHPERVERLVLEEVPPPVPGGTVPGDAAARALVEQLAAPPEDWRAGLEAITAPVMLLSGGLRGHVPHDRLAAMARCISGASLVTIPSGPDVHRLRPEAFADTLNAFLPAPPAPGTV